MAAKQIKSREAFEAEIKTGEGRFALFYSAWCPFCTSFMPAFDSHERKNEGAFIKICTDDLPALEDRFSVDVVPTVLYFKGGKLARRLDGAIGRGLNEEGLSGFLAACGKQAKER